jgi:hypothetical protein
LHKFLKQPQVILDPQNFKNYNSLKELSTFFQRVEPCPLSPQNQGLNSPTKTIKAFPFPRVSSVNFLKELEFRYNFRTNLDEMLYNVLGGIK